MGELISLIGRTLESTKPEMFRTKNEELDIISRKDSRKKDFAKQSEHDFEVVTGVS